MKGIESLGYKVARVDTSEKKSPLHFLSTIEGKFYFCLAFTLPLLVHMFLPFKWLHNGYVQLLLCLPVYAVGFFFFGKSSLGSLRQGVPNMDVLIFYREQCGFCIQLYWWNSTAKTLITCSLKPLHRL